MLTEVMVRALCFFTVVWRATADCIVSGQGAAAETDPLCADFQEERTTVTRRARVGPWETGYFTCS